MPISDTLLSRASAIEQVERAYIPDYAIRIMTLPATKPRFTPEEYLRLETAAQDRHEYHAGEILAMSGLTYRHSRICANLIGETRQRLKGSPCFVLESNMRVRLAEADRYVYPDGTVICEEPQFDPRDINRTTILNSKVVMEVLSDSTEAYDRGSKFSAYRDLQSLSEYVLVSQNEPLVELCSSVRRHLDVFRVARLGSRRGLAQRSG